MGRLGAGLKREGRRLLAQVGQYNTSRACARPSERLSCHEGSPKPGGSAGKGPIRYRDETVANRCRTLPKGSCPTNPSLQNVCQARAKMGGYSSNKEPPPNLGRYFFPFWVINVRNWGFVPSTSDLSDFGQNKNAADPKEGPITWVSATGLLGCFTILGSGFLGLSFCVMLRDGAAQKDSFFLLPDPWVSTDWINICLNQSRGGRLPNLGHSRAGRFLPPKRARNSVSAGRDC